jgi:hypothetical protein
MKASDSIRAARRRIERPKAWCRGSRIVSSDEPGINYLDAAAYELWPNRTRMFIGEANDVSEHHDTTHADVLALYDRAIAMAEKDEGE